LEGHPGAAEALPGAVEAHLNADNGDHSLGLWRLIMEP